ncbi:hypothetical protein AAVH_21266 [Aphelenchoides avenae]|nr:hypothetical protein AAVH_21266 [Aphelenchus avenae]
MRRVDHFSACALYGRKPEACTTPVAKRQPFASNAFLARFNRLVSRELFDVYYVRNESAGATLSVLVAVTSYAGPIILMKGAVQCGDEVPYPAREYGEDYEDQEGEENDYVGDEEEDDMDEEDDDEGTEEEKDEGTEEEKDEGTEEDDF